MKQLLTAFFLIANTLLAVSQEEASNWYFGENAGIKFNSNGTVTELTDGQLDTEEGCTTISDDAGNLLFYTDGSFVYDRTHNVMPNGFDLKGDESSTQSAIVIPKPNDPDIYYIFTVDTAAIDGEDLGFNYYIVDMTLNNGLGDVSSGRIPLLPNCSEKLSAVLQDCQTQSIWVITFASNTGGNNNNTFYAYQVSDLGVNTTPVISTLNININEARGYLKLSPDGTKLACANIAQGLYLFDFDKTTGLVSNPQQLDISYRRSIGEPQSAYGLEFSPTSEILYVTTYFDNNNLNDPTVQYGALLQYDLTATDISASETVIDHRQTYRGGLQLGPDGKIYRAMSDSYTFGSPFLSVINNPNQLGIGCNYTNNAVALTRNSRQGLPPFISSFFVDKIDIIGAQNSTSTYLPLCNGTSYTLTADNIPGAVYSWSVNGTPLLESDHDLVVTQNGLYEVVIDLNNGGCDFLEGEANVEYFPEPIAHNATDSNICDNDNDGNWAFDFSVTKTPEILGNQNPDNYSVQYFESQTDADLNQNPITLPYINQNNPQEIFARVDLTGSPNCFDTTSFFIAVFETPMPISINDQVFCDDGNDGDLSNGQTAVNLSMFNSLIMPTNTQNYTITYHSSLDGATNDTPLLPSNYYNQTPFNETIFVRVENNANPDCFSTTSFNLVVNPSPIANNAYMLQCDEDGFEDGITLFNLNEAITQITNNAPNLSVVFYDASNNELNPTNYTNTSNPEVIVAKVIDNTTNCYSTSQLTLEVSTTSLLDYNHPPVCDELGSEDGMNTFNLDTITTEIQIINGITLPITYYASLEDALIETNALSPNYTNTTPYFQTIFARAENNNGCYGISAVTLTVKPLPHLDDDETVFYCLNTFPQTITLSSGINGAANSHTYSWSNGAQTESIQINQPGSYTVTATTNDQCSKSRTITVEPSNTATIEDIQITDISSNNSITVLVSGEGTYQYALYLENELFANYQSSNHFNHLPPGIYTVEITDIKNNCGSITQDVSVIGYPKFFTPNGDGYNDFWNIFGASNTFQPSTEIIIFNRYGKRLKVLSPLDRGWDGTYNGELMPTDDYWFTVTLQDGRSFKSHFTLKR